MGHDSQVPLLMEVDVHKSMISSVDVNSSWFADALITLFKRRRVRSLQSVKCHKSRKIGLVICPKVDVWKNETVECHVLTACAQMWMGAKGPRSCIHFRVLYCGFYFRSASSFFYCGSCQAHFSNSQEVTGLRKSKQ